MNEMMNYIFSNLNNTDASIRNIAKILKKQTKINNQIGTFAFCMGLYILIDSTVEKKQQKKIDALVKEVEELKQAKGEQ